MTRCSPNVALLACAAVLLLSLHGPVVAEPTVAEAAVAPPTPLSERAPCWRSLADLRTHRVSEEFSEFVAGAPVPLDAAPQAPLTLEQAIAAAKARLSREASPAAIAGLRESPAASSVPGLQGAAVAAVVAGKPSAALAALLMAYDMAPLDPSVLVNLAGLLARMGMPEEALALLDAADALGASSPAPQGLKGKAVALNNRGYALLLLGRWKEAETALREAVAQEPQLSEAARNLAWVLAQGDGQEEARRLFLLGVWRGAPRLVTRGRDSSAPDAAPPDAFETAKTATRPAIAEMIDLSGGRLGKLPTLRHPTDVREITKFGEMTLRLVEECKARVMARSRRSGEVLAELNTRPSGSKSLTERRSHAIRDLIPADSEPDVKALLRRDMDAEQEVTAESYKIANDLKPAFSEAGKIKDDKARRARAMEIGNEGIRRLTPAWNRFDEAHRNYFALAHWYETGIAAQLGDPLWHESAMLDVQVAADLAYIGLLGEAWVDFGLVAGQGVSAAMDEKRAVEEPEALEDVDSPCCGGREGPTISAALGDTLTVSVNCKSVGVEVGTEGWLGAFASAEYSFDGRVTVFAGPKAELGIEGLGSKVGMKDGLYITVDSKGVQDVGARVVFESSTQVAPGVSVSTGVDSMDFSFVPSK